MASSFSFTETSKIFKNVEMDCLKLNRTKTDVIPSTEKQGWEQKKGDCCRPEGGRLGTTVDQNPIKFFLSGKKKNIHITVLHCP